MKLKRSAFSRNDELRWNALPKLNSIITIFHSPLTIHHSPMFPPYANKLPDKMKYQLSGYDATFLI